MDLIFRITILRICTFRASHDYGFELSIMGFLILRIDDYGFIFLISSYDFEDL